MSEARITLAQQAAINALAALVLSWRDGPDDAMLLACLAEDLPVAEADPVAGPVKPVLASAAALLAAAPNRVRYAGGVSWAAESFAAQMALRQFFRWRCAMAREALRPACAVQMDLGVTG